MCYGGSKEELLKKKLQELKELLKQSGIKEGKPKNKDDIVDYLCGITKNVKKCNMKESQYCDDDYMCHVDQNQEGTCIKKNTKHNLKTIEVHGKKIIGTQTAIDKLKKYLQNQKQPTPPKPPKQPTPTPTPPKPPKQPTQPKQPKQPTPKKPKEGDEILPVEELLKQIQVKEPQDLNKLEEVQKEVLKCLGLIQ